MVSIPVIDISEIREKNSDKLCTEIDTALSQVGFLYLKGHGIPKETIDSVFKESKAFFSLDFESKNQCNSVGERKFGFDGRDKSKRDGNTHRETFNMPPYPFDGILEALNPEIHGTVSAMLKFAQESQPVIDRILQIFAKSLKLDDEGYFSKRCAGITNSSIQNLSRMKSSYYPYFSELKAGMERCSKHSDFGLLTLLWQDKCGGLQIQSKDGNWISAEYIPDTIIINTGDLLEYWSGGRYPATVHRVGVSEYEIKNKMDRQSLAYFIIPDDLVPISPLLAHQPSYSAEISESTKSVTVREYMKKQLASVYKANE